MFAKRLGIELEVNMEAVGRIREQLKGVRTALADFDLHKGDFPHDFVSVEGYSSSQYRGIV